MIIAISPALIATHSRDKLSLFQLHANNGTVVGYVGHDSRGANEEMENLMISKIFWPRIRIFVGIDDCSYYVENAHGCRTGNFEGIRVLKKLWNAKYANPNAHENKEGCHDMAVNVKGKTEWVWILVEDKKHTNRNTDRHGCQYSHTAGRKEKYNDWGVGEGNHDKYTNKIESSSKILL